MLLEFGSLHFFFYRTTIDISFTMLEEGRKIISAIDLKYMEDFRV